MGEVVGGILAIIILSQEFNPRTQRIVEIALAAVIFKNRIIYFKVNLREKKIYLKTISKNGYYVKFFIFFHASFE